MAIVYQHRRKDTNEVFYIGVGKIKYRSISLAGRNNDWKNIYNTVGFEADILYEGISKKDAYNVEKGLIESYGRKDLGIGNLVNRTQGGGGSEGYKHSNETKLLWSNQRLNKKRKPHSDETRKKMSEIAKGKPKSEEHKRKLSEYFKSVPCTLPSRKGIKLTDEQKKKLSESQKGIKHGKRSEEANRKAVETRRLRGSYNKKTDK